MTALGYVYMALVVQYLVLKKKTSLQWKVLNSIPITVYALATILTGGRNPLIQFVVAFVVMYYLKHVQIYGKVKFNLKKVLSSFLIGIVALLAFSQFRTVVGRTESQNTWDYLAMYIGAPIKLFDKFVTDPVRISHQYIGQETFPYLWISFFGKTITNWSNLEFRKSSSGINLGNVYTAFRRYYSDFGFIGLIALTALESFFYSLFYLKVSDKKKPSKEIDFVTLLYSFFAVGPVYYSVDDRLFPYYIAKDRLYIIILMFIFTKLLSHVKVGFQVNTEKL
jgi:oligosaccharide repeat unit polymerase